MMAGSKETLVELVGADLTGPFRREILRRAADEAFSRSRDDNFRILGVRLPESLATDGVIGRQPEEMKVGGKSVLTFGRPAAAIIPFTLELAARVSPRGRSNSKPDDLRYFKSHAVFVDGKRLEPPYLMPLDWRQMIFASLSPYTRKIERGLSKQRPNGVYEILLLPEIEAEFGDQYDISFNYVGGLVAAFGKRAYLQTFVAGPPGGKPKRRRRRRKIYDVSRERIPAIIVENRR